jgi:hypothetical protein
MEERPKVSTYTKPSFSRLGSVQEMTLSNIYKSSGSGDVILITGNPPDPVAGGTVTNVS